MNIKLKWIIIVGTAICIALTTWCEVDSYFEVLMLEHKLKVYFEQIDYKKLDLILKKSKKSTEKPPKEGEQIT